MDMLFDGILMMSIFLELLVEPFFTFGDLGILQYDAFDCVS